MTIIATLFRSTISAGVIATAALAGVAHADTRGETAKFDRKTNTYCVSTMVTGSIIPQRECATRQEWIDRGATITPAVQKQIAAK